MGLGLQRDDALDGLHLEEVGRGLVLGGELLHHRTLGKGHIILVGGEYLARMVLGRFLDEREEARRTLLTVDDKRTAEDLVAAVLGVDLRKTEDLTVGERSSVLLLNLVEVGYLLRTQREALFLVVLLDIVHVFDGLRLVIDGEDRLVEAVVHTLEHAVVLGVLVGDGEELLYTRNAAETHVLRDLNGIRTPRRNHLTARTDKVARQLLGVEQRGVAIQPAEGLRLGCAGLMVNLSGNDVLLGSLEEKNHNRMQL